MSSQDKSEKKISNARALREKHARCGNCLAVAQGMTFLKCGRCKDAYYCSKQCQKEAWPAHKPICNAAVRTKAEVTAELGEDFTNIVDKWRNQHVGYLTVIAHLKIPMETIADGVLILDCTYKSSREGPKLMRVQIEQAFAVRMSDVAKNFGQEAVDSLHNLRGDPGIRETDSAYNVLTLCRKEEGDGGIMLKVSCLTYGQKARPHAVINQTLSETNAKVESIVRLINTKEYWNDIKQK